GLAGDWQLTAQVDAATGQIGITLYSLSQTPITAASAGSLVNIVFQVLPGATGEGTVQLVDAATPNGQRYVTDVDDNQGPLLLSFGTQRLTLADFKLRV